MSEYQYYEFLAVGAAGDNVILSLSSDEDPDDYWEEGQERLASIVGVRSGLAAGDLRFLYIAWLLSVQSDVEGLPDRVRITAR